MRRTIFTAVVLCSLIAPTSLFAKAKAYQVTGPIIKLTDTLIVVQNKDKETFEIDRDSDTKIDGDIKVGSKVTVYYTMSAQKIEKK